MRLILYDESPPNHPTCRISLSIHAQFFTFYLSLSVVQLQLNQNIRIIIIEKKNIYRYKSVNLECRREVSACLSCVCSGFVTAAV